MKTRKSLVVLGSICLISILSSLLFIAACVQPASAQPKTYEWRLQHMFPAGTGNDKFTKTFADRVLKMSGGRIKITVFGVNQLAPAAEMLTATAKGVIDLGYSFPPYHTGKIPATSFGGTIPYGFDNMGEVLIYYHPMGAEKILREEYAKQGVHLISISFATSDVPIFSKKPVRKAADFKGLKLRGVGLIGDVLKEAGAAPAFFSGPEIYPALERGVIDAAVWGDTQGCVDLGLHEITKYMIYPITTNYHDWYMRLDLWNALPDDLKEILTVATHAWSTYWAEYSDYAGWTARQKLVKERKFEVINLPPAEVAKMEGYAFALYDRLAAKDPATAKMVQLLKDLKALR